MVEENKAIPEGWGLTILEFGRYQGEGGGGQYILKFPRASGGGVKMFISGRVWVSSGITQ